MIHFSYFTVNLFLPSVNLSYTQLPIPGPLDDSSFPLEQISHLPICLFMNYKFAVITEYLQMPHTAALDTRTQFRYTNSAGWYNFHFAGEAQKFLLTCPLLQILKAEKWVYVHTYTHTRVYVICLWVYLKVYVSYTTLPQLTWNIWSTVALLHHIQWTMHELVIDKSGS